MVGEKSEKVVRVPVPSGSPGFVAVFFGADFHHPGTRGDARTIRGCHQLWIALLQ